MDASAAQFSASTCVSAEGHELPSQNQLYAVLMLSCGAWRVKRPHRRFLRWVDDIESRPDAESVSKAASVVVATSGASATDAPGVEELRTAAAEPRAATSAVGAADTAADVALSESRAPADKQLSAAAAAVAGGTGAVDTPLAQHTALDLGDDYYGNSNLCVLLDLMAHLPLLCEVDWSAQRLFDSDPYKLGVSGNDVVQRLCQWAARQRNLRRVTLGGGTQNPVGTRCVHWIIDALKANPAIVEFEFDTSGVDAFLLKQFERALAANREGRNAAPPPPLYALSEDLKALDRVDRKTSADRRELHTLLRDFHEAFMAPLAPPEPAGAAAAPTQAMALGKSLSMRAPQQLAESRRAGAEEKDELALGSNPLEQFVTGVVVSAFRRTHAECVNASRGLRGNGSSLFIVDSGSVVAHIGGHDMVLLRGDYFGETLESEMFVAGQLECGKRGTCFQVPHDAVAPLMREWEARVQRYLPTLKHAAVLQPLPTWALIRACHDAEERRFEKGEVVITKGTNFAGLFLVLKGQFIVRGRARLGRGQVAFGPSDVFGEEAAVSRLGVYSVDIKASNDEGECVALLISARHAKRHVVPHIRSVLSVTAKAYSDVV